MNCAKNEGCIQPPGHEGECGRIAGCQWCGKQELPGEYTQLCTVCERERLPSALAAAAMENARLTDMAEAFRVAYAQQVLETERLKTLLKQTEDVLTAGRDLRHEARAEVERLRAAIRKHRETCVTDNGVHPDDAELYAALDKP